ncbi:hypothetical protein L9F63_023131 [Diploptera punctata]|uniref:Uncharacterized protein n=1 Tax=Diploptera punctata TaxID=6984 RepID=A0AAD7ZJ77_DIPPU|nr:hypothetical protein L9F63_023131 [Diploptera punctata]
MSDISLSGEVSLETNEDEYMFVSDIKADLSIGALTVHNENILSLGNSEARNHLNKAIGEAIPEIIEKFKESIIPKITILLVDKINLLFSDLQISLSALAMCVINPDYMSCPFF